MGRKFVNLPVCKTNCKTCPWREDSPYAYLRWDLEHSAMTEASRICHSTGANNAINKHTGKPPMLCRGARDYQLNILAGIGFLDEATDEAWERKREQLNQLQ